MKKKNSLLHLCYGLDVLEFYHIYIYIYKITNLIYEVSVYSG